MFAAFATLTGTLRRKPRSDGSSRPAAILPVAVSFELAVCGPGPDRRRSFRDFLETRGSDGR